MPELPEVEITARLLSDVVAGKQIEYVRVPGLNAVKTFDPPMESLVGQSVAGVRRRGKHLVVDTQAGASLLIHLMSAGRLQLFDKPATMRDRTARVLLGLDDGNELRLREFGTRQRA
ncbi:MAG TPA: DNA-formamidopyrimidine glycosylase family protein, partial [Baekduia sp.]|nr:DNA-formamidopyrimidine glycosylase family protein [Baekduia sp.]